VTATAPPLLAADLTEGLKRLKTAAMRRLAPELLGTAKAQRWNPEEFLRISTRRSLLRRLSARPPGRYLCRCRFGRGVTACRALRSDTQCFGSQFSLTGRCYSARGPQQSRP